MTTSTNQSVHIKTFDKSNPVLRNNPKKLLKYHYERRNNNNIIIYNIIP